MPVVKVVLAPSDVGGFNLDLIADDDDAGCFRHYELHLDDFTAASLKDAVLRTVPDLPAAPPLTPEEVVQRHVTWSVDLCQRRYLREREATAASGRCDAAHPDDPTPCEGPHDAVEIRARFMSRARDAMTTGTLGCVHHGAHLLARLDGGRVYPGPDNSQTGQGSATDAFKRAQTLKPSAGAHTTQNGDTTP